MFPLDGLDEWPRLYGSAGFVQYQFVVPRGQEHALEAVIGRLRARSHSVLPRCAQGLRG